MVTEVPCTATQRFVVGQATAVSPLMPEAPNGDGVVDQCPPSQVATPVPMKAVQVDGPEQATPTRPVCTRDVPDVPIPPNGVVKVRGCDHRPPRRTATCPRLSARAQNRPGVQDTAAVRPPGWPGSGWPDVGAGSGWARGGWRAPGGAIAVAGVAGAVDNETERA